MRGVGLEGLAIPPEDDLIERYAMGTCPEEEAAALETHLVDCSDCRVRLSAAKEWITVLRLALRPDMRDPPSLDDVGTASRSEKPQSDLAEVWTSAFFLTSRSSKRGGS
jgi:anti-sigma factor RsiW